MMPNQNLKNQSRSFQNFNLRSQSGQVVVEYVLLLIVSVTLAFLITRTMVGSDVSNPGFVLKTWRAIITQIGKDKADDIKGP